MLCEMCGKNQATFFYKQTKNGYTIEKNLCAACAKKQGLGISSLNLFGTDELPGDEFFGGLLGGFFGEKPQITASKACPGCGMTLGELLHSGRVGCAECYRVFRSALMPSVTKLHGNVSHTGKKPHILETPKAEKEPAPTAASASSEKEPETIEEKIAFLRRKLKEAIDEQAYEDAASYRDEIKALENKKGEND